MDLNSIKGKAQGMLRQNADKIERGIDKTEKFARGRAGKHDGKVDKAAGKLRGMVEKGKGDPNPGTGTGGAA